MLGKLIKKSWKKKYDEDKGRSNSPSHVAAVVPTVGKKIFFLALEYSTIRKTNGTLRARQPLLRRVTLVVIAALKLLSSM